MQPLMSTVSTVATGKPIDLSGYKKHDDGNRVVTAISVLGVPTYPKKLNPQDDTHLVHWRVHLRWAGAGGQLARGSVVLDTYKDGPNDPIVRVDVYSRASLVSAVASKYWEFRAEVVKPDLKVQTFVNLITANGRERYKYDGNGSGCLSWSNKLLSDYVSAGCINAHATEDFADFIEVIRTNEKEFYWIPDDQGTYL